MGWQIQDSELGYQIGRPVIIQKKSVPVSPAQQTTLLVEQQGPSDATASWMLPAVE